MGGMTGAKIFPWVVMTLFLVIAAGIVLFMFSQVQGLRLLTDTRMEYNGERFKSVAYGSTSGTESTTYPNVDSDEFQDAWDDANRIATLSTSAEKARNVTLGDAGIDDSAPWDTGSEAETITVYTPAGKELTYTLATGSPTLTGNYNETVEVKEPLYIMKSNATVYNLAVIIIPVMIVLVALGWIINWGKSQSGMSGGGGGTRMGRRRGYR